MQFLFSAKPRERIPSQGSRRTRYLNTLPEPKASPATNTHPGQAQRQKGDGKPEISSVPRRRACGICSPQHGTSQAWNNSALTQVSSSMGRCWLWPWCKARAPASLAVRSTLAWKRKTPPGRQQNVAPWTSPPHAAAGLPHVLGHCLASSRQVWLGCPGACTASQLLHYIRALDLHLSYI